ncbi:MAG TPA: hypothetical protein VJ891_12230 [Casimicrobiaceae bacterium]|nr:hypothetical protein [Casimicrobiaceae bacterium]
MPAASSAEAAAARISSTQRRSVLANTGLRGSSDCACVAPTS